MALSTRLNYVGGKHDVDKYIYMVFVIIMQSKDDGDWWLHFGYNNENLRPVGLWAKSLFSGLSDHANLIVWGGYTQSHTGKSSPPMGNGQ